MIRRDLLLRSTLLDAAGLLPGRVAAQSVGWAPERTVRIIIPVAPGGSLDILGRVLARHLRGQRLEHRE